MLIKNNPRVCQIRSRERKVSGDILKPKTTLREHADVYEEQGEGRRDAEEEAAEVQARVDATGVADAGDEKDSVGQDGEGKPSEAESFRVERIPVPTGKIHN